LSSRFLEIDRRRCIWRPDRSGADRDLLQQLELQLLYDPCVADRARCKQVTSAAGAAVVARAQALSPLSFHGIRAWYRQRAEQQAQEAKEAVRQQEVIISSPFMFATTPVSELFGRHWKTTSDRGAGFAKTKL
jgi:hypothetical protein